MKRVSKNIRAEIGQPDFDARENDFRRETWEGPAERLRTQMTESSQEVTVHVAVAEGTVTVDGEEGLAARRCSLNLN